MKFKDIQFEIKENYYNKTEVQADGITHKIDTETKYKMYQFGMAKNYMQVNNKEDMLNQLINDLDEFKEFLMRLKESEIENER